MPPLTRKLTYDIRTAYEASDSPPYKELGDRSSRTQQGFLVPATISRILSPNSRDRSLPDWKYYALLLPLLGLDPAELEPRWKEAQDEWRARPASSDGKTSKAGETTAPAPPTWWRRKPRLLMGAVSGVAAAALGAWLLGGDANQSAASPPVEHIDPTMDNTDPVATGCSPDMREQTYYTHLYRDWPSTTSMTSAMITLRYSPKCRTVWAVLEGAPPGTHATLHRADGRELRCTAGHNGQCTTNQLSDRGSSAYADAQAGDAYGKTRRV
ncbi:hypothetical protein Aglo02_03920 [Actinokineospora globicatena]|nr:hypothetical protein Aglo02_03920 [Actinokineospora globicatena]